MAKKPKLPDDCMPKCEDCKSAAFPKDEVAGECHLLPMEWTYAGDGDIVARWRPCVRQGWCRHFERKCNA